jgi:hypothetical protein
MTSERTVDYAAVLADLEAQRAKLDVAIEAIRALQEGGPIPVGLGPAPAAKAAQSNGEIEIALDAFHRLSVSQAIKKYLAMRGRRPATTAEIVAALTAGGQAGADGANYNVVVNNTLNRMQAPDGGISKVKRGVWGLSEWYDSKPE